IAEKAVAIIESIIFLIHINLDAITATGQDVKRIRISGGLSSIDGVCQLLADMSQRLVIRSGIRQSTSRGIAWLAGKPAKDWSDMEDDYFLPKPNQSLHMRYRVFCEAIDWV
ncbi:MAG: FGGY-family carbohydrate kinase, partial [Chloroflexota bacterium]